jgi:hypothetical protein
MGEITHPKKRAFLAAYSICGSLTQAAKRAKIERRIHYHWLRDPDYAEAFAEAREQAGDALEDEAMRRAHAGSDTLVIFLLKGFRPERYRERFDARLSGEIGVATLARDIIDGAQQAETDTFPAGSGNA